jgi:hypothetical protein
MNRDDIIRMALEALEITRQACFAESTLNKADSAIEALRAALAEQLTDEDISVLWHQSGEQPFKFARMLLR